MPLFGEKKDEMDENGRTCLHYAVWGGSLPVMRYLVDCCDSDLGLTTAVSCSFISCISHIFRQDRYSDTYNVYVSTHTQPTHAVHEAPLCPQVCMYAVIKFVQIAHYERCHFTYVGIPPTMQTI